MAFQPKNPGTGTDHSVLRSVIISDSDTIAIGDAVKLTDGYAVRATAGVQMLGIAIGFTDANGLPLTPATYAAGTATGSDVTTVVAASDNTTGAMKRVVLECSPFKVWSVDVTGTIGTTVYSNLIGSRIDVDSAGSKYGYVLETTATRTESTVANFFCYGVDPEDSTRLLVSISSSYMTGKQG